MYTVYIFTNKTKTAFNIGITDNLKVTFTEFNTDNKYNQNDFNFKIKTIYLIYFKSYIDYDEALKAELYLKKTSRLKQEREIKTINPDFKFLSIT